MHALRRLRHLLFGEEVRGQVHDLEALIARTPGARPDLNNLMCDRARLRAAGCPSAELHVLTEPTGGASPHFTSRAVKSPVAQPRQPGRAVVLISRRKERDDFLGREERSSQSPSRKGRRQTLNRCLVRPPAGRRRCVKSSPHELAERQASNQRRKTEKFSPVPGCALLTLETI